MSEMDCDYCDADAAWLVYAAYPIRPLSRSEPHPLLARYPGAMIRACQSDMPLVIHAMTEDQESFGATAGYYLQPTPREDQINE